MTSEKRTAAAEKFAKINELTLPKYRYIIIEDTVPTIRISGTNNRKLVKYHLQLTTSRVIDVCIGMISESPFPEFGWKYLQKA
ncbi:MAG: hypothetical protein ACRCU6_12590 [Fusobacteriaceae bacterium]